MSECTPYTFTVYLAYLPTTKVAAMKRMHPKKSELKIEPKKVYTITNMVVLRSLFKYSCLKLSIRMFQNNKNKF